MAAVLLLHHYTTIGYEKYATLLFPTTVFWAFQSDGHYLHAQQFPFVIIRWATYTSMQTMMVSMIF